MSRLTASRTPSYCRHKSTGQAVVRLNGRDFYLGKFGSRSSKDSYDSLIADWLAKGRQLPDPAGISISELILAYWRRCQGHYRKPDGTETSELGIVKRALRPVRELYGRTPAAEFRPLKLKAIQQRMIADGLCRNVVNKHISRIRNMFKWGVGNELVPPEIFQGLQAVEGLKRGRTDARETEPIKPAPQVSIDAVRPLVLPQVRALIDLQLLTAMRPGEAVIMRGADLDRTGTTWLYRPSAHKTEHHGHSREIYIGPKAQEVIKPFLKDDPLAYLFSADEAREEHFRKLRATRKSKVQPSQVSRRKRNPKRLPGGRYTVASYRRAIARACDQAFTLPNNLGPRQNETKRAWQERLTAEEKAEIKAWRRKHRWHPHRLRHNAGTAIRQEYDAETARTILGHRHLSRQARGKGTSLAPGKLGKGG